MQGQEKKTVSIKFNAMDAYDVFTVYEGDPSDEQKVEQHEAKTCFSFDELATEDADEILCFELSEGIEYISGTAVRTMTAVCKKDGFTICGTFYNESAIQKFLSEDVEIG